MTYDEIASTSTEFITRDPAVTITRSAYGYVGGNPLNRTDPSGLHADDTCKGLDEIQDYYRQPTAARGIVEALRLTQVHTHASCHHKMRKWW